MLKDYLITLLFFIIFYPFIHAILVSTLLLFRSLFNTRLKEFITGTTITSSNSKSNNISIILLLIIYSLLLAIITFIFCMLFVKTIHDIYGNNIYISLSITFMVFIIFDIIVCLLLNVNNIDKYTNFPSLFGYFNVPIFKTKIMNYYMNIHSNIYYWITILIIVVFPTSN